MKFIKKLIFNWNDKKTRKQFTWIYQGLHCVVSNPNYFFHKASVNKWNPFQMACIDGYKQAENGKWYFVMSFAFENHADLQQSGAIEIKDMR